MKLHGSRFEGFFSFKPNFQKGPTHSSNEFGVVNILSVVVCGSIFSSLQCSYYPQIRPRAKGKWGLVDGGDKEKRE